MELKDARTINAAALYDRRKQAVMLYGKGMIRCEIAHVLGMTPCAVGRWIKAWQEEGYAALKVRPGGRTKGSGRKQFPPEAEYICRSIIDHCPDQLKLNFALWTRNAILALIQQKFGITMTLQGLNKYLKKWNFTPQKLIRRAYQRNGAQVEKWLEEEYPSIAVKAQREKGEIHWGDEIGFRSDDVNGRSYAPAGKAPTQCIKGTPENQHGNQSRTNAFHVL